MALNLRPEDALTRFHSGSTFASTLIHYPALSAHDIQSSSFIRNPAHSDSATLTLLFQHQVGGLQVADMSSTDKRVTANVEKSARFLNVELNNEILVLPGYLLRRWTNDIYPGCVHRVSAPIPSVHGDAQEKTSERFSYAYFALPDENTIIEALPTCHSDQRPRKWGPLNASEYSHRKLLETYS
jgi:isopenicillin N synthase-like dioxygenase